MKTVYLIYGVSGAGKSWVCEQLRMYAKHVEHDKLRNNSIPTIHNMSGNILYEKTVHISTTINRNPDINFIPVLVCGDFLQVKQNLINRGGKVTKSLYRRWKRGFSINNKYKGIKGTPEAVVKMLKNIFNPPVVAKGIIYKATTPNNKVYIGQTINGLARRKTDHKISKQLFGKAVRKYGDQIKWEIIDTYNSNLEATIKEIKWISHYKATDKSKGYNLTFGGEGGKPTDEIRIKRAVASLKAVKSMSAECVKQKGDKSKAWWNKGNNRKIMSVKIKRAKTTPEALAKTAADTTAQWADPEKRRTIMESRAKHWALEDNKKAFSKAMRKALAKPFRCILQSTMEEVGVFDNQIEAKDALGIPACGISRVLGGHAKTTRGYIFEYIDPKDCD